LAQCGAHDRVLKYKHTRQKENEWGQMGQNWMREDISKTTMTIFAVERRASAKRGTSLRTSTGTHRSKASNMQRTMSMLMAIVIIREPFFALCHTDKLCVVFSLICFP